MVYILLLLMLITDGSNLVKETFLTKDIVDVIEINHFINSFGEEQLNQVIFLDYSPTHEAYIVRAWRSIKQERVQSISPYKIKGGLYVLCWQDSRDEKFRKVFAKSVTETWTNYDPETVNQELLDRNLRKELTLLPKPNKKK